MSNKKISRRNYVKGAATTLAGVSIVGTVSGNDGQEDEYERALRLREENNWSVDKFHKYLASKGYNIGYKKSRAQVTRGNEEGPTTQEINKTWINLTLSWIKPDSGGIYPYPRIDFDWDWVVPRTFERPRADDPLDLVSIRWENSEFDNAYSSPNGGKYTSEPRSQPALDTSGAIMTYDDNQAANDIVSETPYTDDYYRFGSFMTAALEEESGDPYSQRFYIRYYHTWEDVDYSISWTAGAPSVTFNVSEHKWLADASADRAQLEKSWDCGDVTTC